MNKEDHCPLCRKTVNRENLESVIDKSKWQIIDGREIDTEQYYKHLEDTFAQAFNKFVTQS